MKKSILTTLVCMLATFVFSVNSVQAQTKSSAQQEKEDKIVNTIVGIFALLVAVDEVLNDNAKPIPTPAPKQQVHPQRLYNTEPLQTYNLMNYYNTLQSINYYDALGREWYAKTYKQ